MAVKKGSRGGGRRHLVVSSQISTSLVSGVKLSKLVTEAEGLSQAEIKLSFLDGPSFSGESSEWTRQTIIRRHRSVFSRGGFSSRSRWHRVSKEDAKDTRTSAEEFSPSCGYLGVKRSNFRVGDLIPLLFTCESKGI